MDGIVYEGIYSGREYYNVLRYIIFILIFTFTLYLCCLLLLHFFCGKASANIQAFMFADGWRATIYASTFISYYLPSYFLYLYSHTTTLWPLLPMLLLAKLIITCTASALPFTMVECIHMEMKTVRAEEVYECM